MVAGPEIQRLVADMVAKLVRGYGPEKVILFGSYAWGTPDGDSDLDLFIIKDTADRYIDRCYAVRRLLSDPQRMTPLETMVLTPGEVSRRLAVGDQFVARVLEEGEVLYET